MVLNRATYLIAGAGHAGLSAAHAIRLGDKEGTITLVSGEGEWPYSPTILPYVISDQVSSDRVFLRDGPYFEKHGINYVKGAEVMSLDPVAKWVELAGGERFKYDKLLICTGAEPELPPIPGLEESPYHVLRTLQDAREIRSAMKQAKSALVVGAGLVGLHAAEHFARAALEVTVVEAEPRVLSGYFDEDAAAMIEKAFEHQGVKIVTKSSLRSISSSEGGCRASLENGSSISADLLLVATGVRPRVQFITGSGLNTDKGIIVDDQMRTNLNSIWAAGDVAQAKHLFGLETSLNATLPDAVEQGRIAGMDMVRDPAMKPYPGGVPMNVFGFFGNRAFSVGLNIQTDSGDFLVKRHLSSDDLSYKKLVFKRGNLVGAAGINVSMDPGIMWQLIRRRVEFGERMDLLAEDPKVVGRLLMTTYWR